MSTSTIVDTLNQNTTEPINDAEASAVLDMDANASMDTQLQSEASTHTDNQLLNLFLKLHGPLMSKSFKTKAITQISSYISNLDIGAYTYQLQYTDQSNIH